jgi:excisionase family DNA binding protein
MTKADTQPLFNSVSVAAKRLSIGRTMFFKLLKEGKIQACRLGCRTLIAESELQRFAATIREGKRADTDH